MVHIVNFERGTQAIRPHVGEVTAYIQTVTTPDHTNRVHVSTFGSEGRASAPKSSQSLQLDSNSAAELVAYLRDTFGQAWLDAV